VSASGTFIFGVVFEKSSGGGSGTFFESLTAWQTPPRGNPNGKEV
jgi:hypothetical protein